MDSKRACSLSVTWHPNFQPFTAPPTIAAMWIQLHHFPIELWHVEVLEVITCHIGRLMKIDNQTIELNSERSTKIYIELDLS